MTHFGLTPTYVLNEALGSSPGESRVPSPGFQVTVQQCSMNEARVPEGRRRMRENFFLPSCGLRIPRGGSAEERIMVSPVVIP